MALLFSCKMRGSPNIFEQILIKTKQKTLVKIFEQILMRNRVSRAEAVVTYGESKRKTIEKRTVKRQSFFSVIAKFAEKRLCECNWHNRTAED